MAHTEQISFIKRTLELFPQFKSTDRLLEIGSQNINGTARDFLEAKRYIGIDLTEASGVDYVCAGELIELPDAWADVVISTECLEHTEDWKQILVNSIRICTANGIVILTFAGLYRPAHGTIDSKDPDSSPLTQQHYANLDMNTFMDAIKLSAYFDRYCFEANSDPGDSYFWGIRSREEYADNRTSKDILLGRLARAQGQLGQALSRLANANRQLAHQEEEIRTMTDAAKNQTHP